MRCLLHTPILSTVLVQSINSMPSYFNSTKLKGRFSRSHKSELRGLVLLRCQAFAFVLPVPVSDVLLDFQTRISDQFTKNTVFMRSPCHLLYPNLSRTQQELFTSLHLFGLWAQAHPAQLPLTSMAPKAFHRSCVELILNIHYFFPLKHSTPYIHGTNFQKTRLERKMLSSISHFPWTCSCFLLWCSSCLVDVACRHLLIVSVAFPRIPPQFLAVLPTEGHTSFSAGAPYTNLSGVSFPSGSVAYSPLVSLDCGGFTPIAS